MGKIIKAQSAAEARIVFDFKEDFAGTSSFFLYLNTRTLPE